MKNSFVPHAMENRKTSVITLLLAAGLALGLCGCVSRKQAPKATEPTPGADASRKQVMTILSEPIGLTVVVNGVPVGKTPYELEVETTAKGFFAKEIAIKVRFLATQPGQLSRTIEEVLSPLDKMPSSLMFSPEGVGRAVP